MSVVGREDYLLQIKMLCVLGKLKKQYYKKKELVEIIY